MSRTTLVHTATVPLPLSSAFSRPGAPVLTSIMSWLRRGRAQEGAFFRQETEFAAARLRRELKEKGLLVESTPRQKAAWEDGASEILPEILQVSLKALIIGWVWKFSENAAIFLVVIQYMQWWCCFPKWFSHTARGKNLSFPFSGHRV